MTQTERIFQNWYLGFKAKANGNYDLAYAIDVIGEYCAHFGDVEIDFLLAEFPEIPKRIMNLAFEAIQC